MVHITFWKVLLGSSHGKCHFIALLNCILYDNNMTCEGLQQVLSCNLSLNTGGESECPQKWHIAIVIMKPGAMQNLQYDAS
jgi:hypothetical protein